jgi:tripartite-type tricarboxylate transporter receptor subunit TctC
MISGFKIALGLVAATLLTAVQAAYPERPVTLVVPFSAGGPADAMARVLAHAMGARLGQPVIVDNKPGAGGVVGIGGVARAAPDGYTIGMAGTGAMVYSPFILAKMPFDPLKGVTHITTVVRSPNVLVVSATSPLHTVQDLIAQAKANPGRMTLASAGVGSSTHVVGELLQREAGIKMVHVPYKGGAPALQDLMGGQVDTFVAEVPGVVALVKAGKVRALVVSDKKRFAGLGDVPTANEAGLPGWIADGAYGLVGPPGLPADITKRLQEATVEAMRSPEVTSKLAEQGNLAQPGSPEQYRTLLRTEQERWKPVIRAANIAAE